MNISKIIRKILLEDDEKKGALGLNPEDQYTFLNGAINNCPRLSMFKGRPIRNISKDDLNAFPEIKNKGITVAYYATGIIGDSYYMIFGIINDEASTRLKTKSLFCVPGLTTVKDFLFLYCSSKIAITAAIFDFFI
jgi:hypothetical protein